MWSSASGSTINVKGQTITVKESVPDPGNSKNTLYTANWGGTINAGDSDTESLTIEGLRTSAGSTNLRGKTIKGGNFQLWGGNVSIGSKDNTGTVTIDNISNNGNLSIKSKDSIEINQNIGSTNDNHAITTDVDTDGNLLIHGVLTADKNDNATYHAGKNFDIGGSVLSQFSNLTMDSGKSLGIKGNVTADYGNINMTAGNVEVGDGKFYGNVSVVRVNEEDPESHISIRAIDGDILIHGSANLQDARTVKGDDKGTLTFTADKGNVAIEEGINASGAGTVRVNAADGDVTLGTDDNKYKSGITLGADVSINAKNITNYGSFSVSKGSSWPEEPQRQSRLTVSAEDTVRVGESVYADNSIVNFAGKDISIANEVNGTGNSQVKVSGNNISAGSVGARNSEVELSASDSLTIRGMKNYTYRKAVTASDSNVTLGGDKTKVLINGGILFQGERDEKTLHINGLEITLDGSDNIQWNKASQSLFVHEANAEIGNTDSQVTIHGHAINSAGNLFVNGRTISIDEGVGDALTVTAGQSAGWNRKELATNTRIGSDTTETVSIKGSVGVNCYWNTMDILGKNIFIDNAGKTAVAVNHYDDDNPSRAMRIGDENTENTVIKGTVASTGGATLKLDGKNISLSDAGLDERKKDYNIISAIASPVVVGSKTTENLYADGNVKAYAGDITMDGKNIVVKGDGKVYAVIAADGNVTVGSSTTENNIITGGAGAYGSWQGKGNNTILGKDILLKGSDTAAAGMTAGGKLAVGSNESQNVTVDGGLIAHGASITVKGTSLNLSAGSDGNAVYTDGGAVTIGEKNENAGHITGNLVNDSGSIAAWLTGEGSDFSGKTEDNLPDLYLSDADGITVGLSDGASWHMTEDSSLRTLYGNHGSIYLTEGKLDGALKARDFTDNGSTIHEDIDGSGNTGNDRLYIFGTHSGNTHFWLDNLGTTTKGTPGTILASVNDEKGSFDARGATKLVFKKYDLGTKPSTIEGYPHYTTDWYIKSVENSKTDDHGNYTPSADSVIHASSLLYNTWRTENLKMLQRIGDLRNNGEADDGLWARVSGTRIGREGTYDFTNQYKTYELGYDRLKKDTPDGKKYQGLAFSYLDGDSGYPSGHGDNHAGTFTFYSTDIKKDGSYKDVVFRLSHMNNDFHRSEGLWEGDVYLPGDVSGHMKATGISLGIEYGKKIEYRNGWFIEPQTQWTAGYLSHSDYTTSNGIKVEEDGIPSVVGRIGFNAGKTFGNRGIVYAKANLYHEFGGITHLTMRDGEDALHMDERMNDTWLEYGIGMAYSLGKNYHIYADLEKSTGSDYYKDWMWNVGVRYSF